MRFVVVGMLALVGCDQVLGLETRDAPIEITPTVVSIDHPPLLVTLDTATITAHVTGVAGTTVLCTFSAMGGSVADGNVMVTFDDSGAATPSAEYTAPATVGDVTLRAAIGDSEVTSTMAIVPVVTVGYDQPLFGYAPTSAGLVIGSRVDVSASFSPLRIGVWMKATSPGTQGRLGVYRDDGMLVGQMGPVPVNTGRNVFPVVFPALAPGTYWIVSVLDAAADYSAEPATTIFGFQSSAPSLATQPLPQMRPPGADQMKKFSHFLIGNN